MWSDPPLGAAPPATAARRTRGANVANGTHLPQDPLRMNYLVRRLGIACLAAITLVGSTTSCVHTGPHLGQSTNVVREPSAFVAQFDTLWLRFNELYPSFGYKEVDWHLQRERYRDRMQTVRTQAEFISIARDMLEPLRDLHIWFIDPRGQAVPTYEPTSVANFDATRWRRALADAGYVKRGDGIGEAYVGTYGYLYIPSWGGPSDVQTLDLALTRLRDAPGLIIDVRTNAGGNDGTAFAFASRFITQSFAASYIQVRNGPEWSDLDTPVARTVSPRGAWQYVRPVVLITGRGGLSATESFVAAMRTLPQVIVIGDTTGGASGNPAVFSLGNGWSFTVPQWIEYGPDRQPIEGRGIAPQVMLPWVPSQYDRDRDPLIDAAVGILGERNGLYRIAPAAQNEGGPSIPNSDNNRVLPTSLPNVPPPEQPPH